MFSCFERIMIDLNAFKEYNDGYSWFLTIVGVYFKVVAFAYPLKSKSPLEVKYSLYFSFIDMELH